MLKICIILISTSFLGKVLIHYDYLDFLTSISYELIVYLLYKVMGNALKGSMKIIKVREFKYWECVKTFLKS